MDKIKSNSWKRKEILKKFLPYILIIIILLLCFLIYYQTMYIISLEDENLRLQRCILDWVPYKNVLEAKLNQCKDYVGHLEVLEDRIKELTKK